MANFRKLPDPHPPQVGQESVWDYPRPPALDESHLCVEVSLQGVLIARTNSALRVLETSHPPTFYIPPSDIDTQFLSQTGATSFCEWKGVASYWDVTAAGTTVKGGSWTYLKPTAPFDNLRGYFSFYPSSFECSVDGTVVEPQPGAFYGGWVTKNVVGPFKGDPGSEWW